MFKAIAAATTVAVATAGPAAPGSRFYWQPNNDFSNDENWQWASGAKPAGSYGILDLNVECINSWGTSGGEVRLDTSMTISEVTLPQNGEIILAEGTTLTFEQDNSAPTQQWSCEAKDTACHANYLVVDAATSEYVDPERAPCWDDTIIIDGTRAHAITWFPNQHIGKIVVEQSEGEVAEYEDEKAAPFSALWQQSNRSFRGHRPVIGDVLSCGGAAACTEACFDSCPKQINHDTDKDKFFDNLEDQIRINQGKLDTSTSTETSFEDILDGETTTLTGSLAKIQADWEASTSEAKGEVGTIDIESLTVNSKDMYDWMLLSSLAGESATALSRAEQNSIFFLTTKKLCVDSLNWLAGLDTSTKRSLWSSISSSETGTLAGSTISNFGFFLGDGLESNGLLNAFETYDLGLGLAPVGTAQSTVTGAAYSATQDTDYAPGAYVFENFKMTGTLNAAGDKLYLAPTIAEKVFAAVVTKFALHYQSNILAQRIENLAGQISAKTVSPTTSPTISPTVSPTLSPVEAPLGMLEGANGIMIYGGAGGGLVLIILIIVIACMLSRKSDDAQGKPEEARNVVAFENPMYDDPAQTGAKPGADDPGLYDEPTFNQDADKENPMYQSQEIADDGAAGGYLDVQPDDDDDDEDDEDDDE